MRTIEDGRNRRRSKRVAIVIRCLSRDHGATLAELCREAECGIRTAKGILREIAATEKIQVDWASGHMRLEHPRAATAAKEQDNG